MAQHGLLQDLVGGSRKVRSSGWLSVGRKGVTLEERAGYREQELSE